MEKVALITAAVTAYSSIAATMNSNQREDVRGVGILLYTGKL
jgi:HEAT repeat-containing protein 5